MYATVRTYTGGGALADALAANEDAIRGVISTIPGFHAYYLIRTADGAITLSLFDDQAGAEASTSAAAAWMAENMADLSVAPPQVATGEVAFSF